ncbi:MAG: suppressor of fused domain protein [Thomasclavelia sp.]|nr:suppressor of fused domain protein [Thomasclavelia sp.]
MSVLKEDENSKIMAVAEDGYFYKARSMLFEYLEDGLSKNEFTIEQAYHDLDVVLLLAYCNNNIDDYNYYVNTIIWMLRSQDVAKGSGTFYYRLACALIYTNRLDDAMYYSKKGIEEDPTYPWSYLELASLKAHFGDKKGALKAIDKGLELVPGDYEFLTRKKDIEEDKDLMDMMFHYIKEEDDNLLHGTDEELRLEKMKAVSTVLLNADRLIAIKKLLNVHGWMKENWEIGEGKPNCTCLLEVDGKLVDTTIELNEAGVSNIPFNEVNRIIQGIKDQRKLCYERIDKMDGGFSPQLAHITLWSDYHICLFYTTKEKSFTCFYRNQELIINEDLREYPRAPFVNYLPDEYNKLENFYNDVLGPTSHIMYEPNSEYINESIRVIKPTKERNYYTLITMGAGAVDMPIPDEYEGLSPRFELMITLPANWDISCNTKESSWPFTWLKGIAHYPFSEKSFICFGTSFSDCDLGKDTYLSGFVIINPSLKIMSEENNVISISDDKSVRLYQLIPVYQDELDYKKDYGIDELIKKFNESNLSPIVDLNRECLVEKSNKN